MDARPQPIDKLVIYTLVSAKMQAAERLGFAEESGQKLESRLDQACALEVDMDQV